MTAGPNVLGRDARPLFFRVAPASTVVEPPAIRLGEAVRAQVRSLSVMQKEALIASARTGAVWRLASDEGAYLDGADEAPCPLAFLTTGMVCAYLDEILALAGQRGIEIGSIRLIQDNYYTMQGSALKGTMTGGARDVELEAQIDSGAPRDSLAELLHDATIASPLNGLMQPAVASLFSLSHNGRAIEPGNVRKIESAAIPVLGDEAFNAAEPDAGDFSEVVSRAGMTPVTDEATSYAGSSLAEHQDRVLHVRGICTLRDDGLKHVEQQLFNPHGSIFHFLSDEAPTNGESARAPDAATYISAGIAFCFMTQFGRYAKITRKALDDYRIAQDTHFSPGGASGKTGEPGTADPVETHVELTSAEDDAFARKALDMAEQTCFLHALCRSKLRARIRLRPYAEAA